MNLDAFQHGYSTDSPAIYKSASEFEPPSLPLLELSRNPAKELKKILDKKVPRKVFRPKSPAAKKPQGMSKGEAMSPAAKRVWENYKRQNAGKYPNYREGVTRQIPYHSIEI